MNEEKVCKDKSGAIKSSLVGLALAATLLWPKQTLAYEVGDKMPVPKGTQTKNIYIENYGAVMKVFALDGVYEQNSVYKLCDGKAEARPFAAYDFKNKIVYIDADRDGIIDRKDQGANIKRPADDMPECK